MTETHPYTVPVISGDLRRAEFVKQLADTFDYLDAVSQDMFNRIAIRLNVYRAQLNKFDERIQHANAHIDRIKGSKRAIQVHSSARYPVEQNRSTYRSIFEIDNNNEDNTLPTLHYNLFRLNEATDKFIDRNDKESKSNDDTIIVLKQYEDNFIQKTKNNTLHGLGKPPTNIKSVVSFLKYNTQENPYTQSTKIDPLNVGGRIRKQPDESAQPRIVETPLPAFYSQMSERPKISDYGYSPTLGIVPQLSLPDNLPELDNYATFDENTTIDWTGQQMTSIAPSFAISMLPDITELSSSANTTVPHIEPPKPTVSAPPPVDLPAIIPLTSVSNSIPQAPPPAPPLPSTVPSVLIPSSSSANESQASGQNEVNVTSHSNNNEDDGEDDDGGNPLLAQIRNFAKTKSLKSTKKSNPVDDAPLPTSTEQESIMDSLKKKLLQRRKVIMGDSASAPANANEKPIPAPPAPSVSTGASFTDAIVIKAKEIAEENKRLQDDSADDSEEDEDWE